MHDADANNSVGLHGKRVIFQEKISFHASPNHIASFESPVGFPDRVLLLCHKSDSSVLVSNIT